MLAVFFSESSSAQPDAGAESDAESLALTSWLQQNMNDWQKTAAAYKLQGLCNDLGPASKCDMAEQTSVQDALAAWAKKDGMPIGTAHATATTSTGQLQGWLESSLAAVAEQASEKASEAASALEARAEGGPDGTSWKAKLDDSSTWEDVLRESSYHLFPGKSKPITADLEPLFDAASKALIDLQACSVKDDALESRLKIAMMACRITCTEAPSADHIHIERVRFTVWRDMKSYTRWRVASGW